LFEFEAQVTASAALLSIWLFLYKLSSHLVLRDSLAQVLENPPDLEKIVSMVDHESLIQVRQTPSAFHRPAQRNAFRRRDVRLQSRSFARCSGVI
jgi:hypothetical protein